MAGSPKRRARREAAAAASAQHGPLEPLASAAEGVTSLSQGAGTRAHTREPSATRHTPTGSHVRHALDQQEAADVHSLQGQLRPKHLVRITRTKPQWAYGWLEDYALSHGTVGELLEYLRDEHGGQFYQLEVLSRDGKTVLYTAEQPIAGPVKRAGRVCNRDQWEGNEQPARPVERTQPTAAAAPAFNPFDIVDKLISLSDKSTKATADLVERMHANNSELLAHALETRVEQGKPQSIGDQLQQFVSLTETVDKARTKLGRSKDSPPTAAEAPDPVKSAMGQIFVEAFKNDQARGRQQQQPQSQRRLRRVQQPTQTNGAPPPTAADGGGVERLTRTQTH